MKMGMQRHSRSKTRALPAMLAVIAMLVAACSSAASGTQDESGSTASGGSEDSEASGTTADSGKPVKLVYASFAAENSPHSQAFVWLADQLKEKTNGRVTIEPYYSGSLCAYNDMIDCLRDGRTDFALLAPVQSPKDIPAIDVASGSPPSRNDLGDIASFKPVASSDPGMKDEWKAQGMVPLWFASIGPAVLGAKEVVPNLEWLKGKSIRSTGYFSDALNAVGANPVAMPNSDVYESMQRGVIDAFYASTLDGAALDNRHFEVTKHWYDLGAGEYMSIATAVSQHALDQLAPDEQKILLDLADQVRKDYFDKWYFPMMDKGVPERY